MSGGESPVHVRMSILFGFHMPNFTFPGVPNDRLFDRVVENAKAAEKAGFDLVTVMDHFYQIRGIGPETEPMMEAYTTLGRSPRARRESSSEHWSPASPTATRRCSPRW